MKKVAIVTGGSSGIGRCTAQALRDAGCKVWELSRRDFSEPGISHISADVTDEAQVYAAIKKILAEDDRIDILVNNAGFGISGAAEFTENADAKKLLDVNLFGMVNMAKAVIPAMRAQGAGRIVNLSSVAAVTPIPFQAWYTVTKAAVNGYTMALANEVKPFGITVCAVMPGDIRTGFTAAREKSAAGDDIYGGRIARSVGQMERDEQNGMEPAVAGRFIARTALKKRVKPLTAIGGVYKLFSVLAKILPARLVNFILYRMYAK